MRREILLSLKFMHIAQKSQASYNLRIPDFQNSQFLPVLIFLIVLSYIHNIKQVTHF